MFPDDNAMQQSQFGRFQNIKQMQAYSLQITYAPKTNMRIDFNIKQIGFGFGARIENACGSPGAQTNEYDDDDDM